MKDNDKTKEQLINELTELRQRINELEEVETELHTAVEALKASQKRFRDLVETTSEIVWEADKDAVYTYVSSKIYDILGYEPEEMIGKTPLDFIPPEETSRIVDIIHSMTTSQKPFSRLEKKSIHKNGHQVILEISGVPFFDTDGIFLGYRGIARDITEHKQAEEALWKSEEKYRTLVENVNIGVYRNTGDPHGSFLQANPAIAKMFGYNSVIDFMEVSVSDLYQNKEERKLFIDEALQKGFVKDKELSLKKKDGTPIWASCTAKVLYDQKGNIQWIDGVIEDITERKQAEETLRKSEEKYRELVENANSIILRMDSKGNITFINEFALNFFGYTENEILGRNVMGAIVSETESSGRDLTAMIQDIGQHPERYAKNENENMRKNGERIWVMWTNKVVFDENGHVSEILCIGNDMTERKKVDTERQLVLEALKRSEEKFRQLFEMESDAIFLLDYKTGHILESNSAASALYGYSHEELLQKKNTDLSAEPGKTIKAMKEHRSRIPIRFHRKKKGNVFPVEITARHFTWHGHDVHLVAIRDITERQEAQEEIENQRIFLKKVIDSNPSLICVKDRKGRVILANRPIANNFGMTVEQIIGKTALELIPDKAVAEVVYQDDMDILNQKLEKIEKEEQYRDKSGNIHWAYTMKLPMKDKDGKVEQMIKVSLDITGRKQAEEALEKARAVAEAANQKLVDVNKELERAIARANEMKRQAEMASVAKSEFLANMSHEIRTPMNAVLGFTELLKSLNTDKKQKSYLEAIESSGKSLLTLINDILDLSKIEAGKMELHYESVNLHSIFQEIKHIFSLEIFKKGLDFIIDIDPGIPKSLLIDEVRLRQILFNLIGNAVKFTERGYISLSAKKIFSQEDKGSLNFVIAVEDTGIGIPKDSQKKIFEAFKQQDGRGSKKYGGTGLGLSITKRLVEMMGGSISVRSEVNRGSFIELFFRNIHVSRIRPESKKDEFFNHENVSFEEATILVVDDIEINRLLVKEFLEDTNTSVIEAEEGEQSIMLARQYRPDVILMDIRMPVIDGYEAKKQIKQEREIKNIPIIALTAYGMREDQEKIMRGGFDGYLTKPVRKEALFMELARFVHYTINEKEPAKFKKQTKRIETSSIAPEKLHEVTHQLEREFMSQWKSVRRSGFFDDIESFGHQIKALGEKYAIEILKEYSDNLNTYVSSFDIEKIRSTLDVYPQLIEKIKGLNIGGYHEQ